MEVSTKIPIIVYYLAALAQGHVVNEVLSVVDFAPTILSLTNTPTQTKRAGRDFSTLLKGNKAPEGWRDAIFMIGTDNHDDSARDSWVTVVSKKNKQTLSTTPNNKP